MTSKRPLGDNTVKGPNPKQKRTKSYGDGVSTDYGNDMKNEENIFTFDRVHNYKSLADVDDFDDQVNDEPFEVKDEPFNETEQPWDADEKPLVCEVAVELDDIGPLRTLNAESDVKDEPMEGSISKTDDIDGFEGNSESTKPIQSITGDEDLNLKVHRNMPKPRDGPMSRHISLQDDNVALALKNSVPVNRIASKLQRDVFQQPSTSRAHVVSPRPQKEDVISEPKTHRSSVYEIGTAIQKAGKEDRTKAETPKSFSNPPTLSNEPNSKSDDPDTSVIQLLVEAPQFLMNNRTKEQENNILRAGRPTPLMGGSSKFGDSKNIGGFWATEMEYQQILWLTGLKKYFKYFCWPCLLFTKERWSLKGGECREKFWEAINEHSADLLHRVAYKNLQLRESELRDSKTIRPNPKDLVRKNRAFLALLLQILCYKKTKLHNTDSNFDGYEELMKVAISNEPKSFGKPLSEDALIDFVSRHAQKLLSSIQTKIAVRIYDEISNTPFVSVVYEDTESVVDRCSQVAVILRFVTKNGDICERFVKFLEIGQSRNAYDILEIHLALVEELGLSEKLVGYTFSGTVVAPASIGEFTSIVSKYCPKAKFFHHPDHNLKELLLQSLSHLEECQRFLQVISDLVQFLTTNSGAIPTLATFIKHHQPNCQRLDDPRSFTTDIISTIKLYYPLIIEFFFNVSQKFWNDEVAKHAPIFMKFLQEPSSRFLIAVIAAILDAVDDLCKVMEKDYDPAVWKTQSKKVLDTLNKLQRNGVKHFLYLASNSKLQQSEEHFINILGIPKYCPEVFAKIIETAMNCILYRASKADSFYLNSTYSKVSDILRAPEIWNRYGVQFDSQKEYHEHTNFINVFSSTFTKKSIPEIVKFVSNMQLGPKLQKWHGFVHFCALAISPTKSTLSAPSAVLRLKSYLYDKEKFNPTEVLMFLGKDLLHSQLKTDEFIEDVITHYAKKNNQYNFLHEFEEICQSEIGMLE